MAYRLQKSVTTLGRHPRSDVVIPKSFDMVSREHAQIRYENGRYVLHDTSSQGTWVNGQRVNRKPLQDGDRISLAGQVDFIFSNGALHNPQTERFAPAPTRRAAPPPSAPQRPAYPQHRVPPRSGGKERVTTALLALLLGGIGAHKFYLGKTAEGILYLLFAWTGIPAIIALIEGIQYLSMTDEAFDYQFNR